jgi:hypothetical protein
LLTKLFDLGQHLGQAETLAYSPFSPTLTKLTKVTKVFKTFFRVTEHKG